MIHYIYKIEHPNGKYYLGRHSTKNIDDGYMGSGKWVRSLKDPKVLTKTIIEECQDVGELFATEKRYINEYISDPLCMNFNNNPVGFASGTLNPASSDSEKERKKLQRGERNGMYQKKHTAVSRNKMSESRKGSVPWNKGKTFTKTVNNQVPWNKGVKTGIQTFTGRNHSPETINKMKEGHSKRVKLECPHCSKIVDKPNYTRYHGDKCKLS
jgi:hypothetical protein